MPLHDTCPSRRITLSSPADLIMISLSSSSSSSSSAAAAAGEEVVPYMGPRPPVGIHRYVLVLLKQKSRFSTRVEAAPPASRANFSTRTFAVQHDLGLPVAAVYFNAQKEPAKRRR